MNGSDNDRQIEVEELLAAEELDPSDFALLNSLRAYYDERDPVPDGLVDRIQFHVTLDALHTEVATLTQLDMAAAGTRSTTTEAVRTITFTSDSLTTMVTLTPVGGRHGTHRRLGRARRRHPSGGAAGRWPTHHVRRRRRSVCVRGCAQGPCQVRLACGT